MSKPARSYPSLTIDTAGTEIVSQAGATLLVETVRQTGLDRAAAWKLAGDSAPDHAVGPDTR